MFRSDPTPKISILIAARNEEANIERCLISVDQLNYHKSHFEVLIGDDGSTDATADIIQRFIGGKPNFKYIRIEKSVADLKGKANVLEQLSAIAQGEFYFFCDADITVNPDWLNELVKEFAVNTGVVVGVTRMTSGGFFTSFLSLEWMLAMLITRFFSFFKIPITGLGNNMAVSRKAYQQVGGYEKLGFSVVEDYTLFMAIVKNGFDFSMCYKPEILSQSEPLHSLKGWLAQRKRWMQGVMLSTWTTRFTLIVNALFCPILLVLAFWQPAIAFWLFILNYSLVTLLTVISVVILRQYDLWRWIPLFWFYLFGSSTLMLINYFQTGKVVWKGRTY